MNRVEDTIVEAISSRRVVEFRYRQLPRIAEPHTLGISTDGTEQLLAYQVAGGSASGSLPDWRRFDVVGIESIAMRDEPFPQRTAPSGRHAEWQTIIAFVPEAT